MFKRKSVDIFTAIERGDMPACRAMLDNDPGIIAQTDHDGRTALQVAAHKRHAGLVAMLLAAGADLHWRDTQGATALHWAAVGGDARVIEQLIAAGADVNAIDKDSFTPGQLAKMRGHPDLESLLGRFRPRT